MLDKYSISLKYHVNGNKKAVVSTEKENDDYIITERVIDADHLVLDFATKDDKSITIDDFTLNYYYDYLPRYKQFQRIFANGYQSWTASREYFPDEHSPVFKGKKIMGYVGDYAFTTDSKERGRFRSVSYTYIRNNDDFELFGSLNEASGYTIFYYDVIAKKFRVSKDVEGVKFDSNSYEIMNIARYRYEGQVAFDKWFSDMKIAEPRIKQANGYTTWYNYYANINEKIINRDLESIAELDAKIDIFQIDDGYETCVGDWTSIKKGFGDMPSIVSAIHEKGLKAGIWLAPFAVSQKSKLYKEHKDWLIKDEKGKPFLAGKNWGGFYTLNFYDGEVINYLEGLFGTILNEWGFDMVKLDHLYQACIIPFNGKSRGEVMTDAMNLLRRLCGDKLMLATGVPLYPAFGKADMCRIGPDMGLKWDSKKKGFLERVSTTGALNNTIFRHHLNGRAFANDPDVFLLRDNNMKMTAGQRKIVATINKVFGDVLFTSDNVAKYKHEWQKEMLLDMFNDDDMKIMGAEYVTNNILHIKCFKGNTPTLITIDMKQGVMLKQEVDAKELKVTDIDDRLSARGGADYQNALSTEDDNYDDLELDRELTPEEIAENEEKKRKLQVAKEKRRQELIATKMAEREAKKVAKAMKKKGVATNVVEEEVTASEDVSPVETAPAVEENPVVEPTPAQEEAPVEEPKKAKKEKKSKKDKAEEPTPAVEETPVEEPAPAQEEASIEEPALAEEEAPVEEPAPAQEDAPIEEPAPAQEEAPVEEEKPKKVAKPKAPKVPKPTKAPKVKKTEE